MTIGNGDLRLEQLFYTSAETSRARGYQFIAWSPGTTEQDKTIVETYSAPSRIIPVGFEFRQATLFIGLGPDRFGIMRMANIGDGFDGRPNTIFTHTIIVDSATLKKVDGNFLAFEPYFDIDKGVDGEVSPITTDSLTPVPALTENDLPGIIELMGKPRTLSLLLEGLLTGRTTVLIVDPEEDPKAIIAQVLYMLPDPLRTVFTFTSQDLGVSDRKEFSLVLIPKEIGFRAQRPDINIVDAITGESNIAEAGHYPTFIAERIFEKDIDSIREFNHFSDNYEVQLGNVDNLFNYWVEKRRLSTISDKAERVDAFYTLAQGISPFSMEEANHYIGKAISLIQKMKDPRRLAKVYSEYYNTAHHIGKADEALTDLQSIINNYLNSGDIKALRTFVKNYHIPQDEHGRKAFETLLKEIEPFLEDEASGDMMIKLNRILIDLLTPMLREPVYRDRYLMICKNGMTQFQDDPKMYADYLRCYRYGTDHLPLAERMSQYPALIQEFQRLGLSDEAFDLRVENINSMIDSGSSEAPALVIELLREGFASRRSQDAHYQGFLQRLEAKGRTDWVINVIDRILTMEGARLSYNTAVNSYKAYVDATLAYPKDMENVDALNIPEGYIKVLNKVIKDNFGTPLDNRDKKRIMDDVWEALESWVEPIAWDSMSDERYFKFMTRAITVFLSYYREMPGSVRKAIVKRARLHREQGDTQYFGGITKMVNGLKAKYARTPALTDELDDMMEDITKKGWTEKLRSRGNKDETK